MTRRCSRIKVCSSHKLFTAMALAVLGISLTGHMTPARADAHSYASVKRQVKACVLVSNASTRTVGGVVIPENAVPYVFYMLDRRTDLKPAGWDFVNPLAPSTVSGDIRQRWLARDTGATDTTLANPIFALGAPLTKNIGAYWEVNLDSVSQSDLQKFDIVLMAYHTNATGFSPAERDLLRKYVDAGGTVWLEDEGGFDIQTAGNHDQNQFIVDTAFNGAVVNAATPPSLATLHHPMVNFPFPISNVAIQALGAGSIGTHHIAVDPIAGPVNARVVVPVIWSGPGTSNRPLVYAGDYGAGHIIVSSAGIATDINSYAGGATVAGENGNSGAVSGENTLGVQLIDAEFAINMVAWTSTVSTGGFNARRTGSSQEDIGYGLSNRWSTVATAAVPSTFDSGASIYKNCAFYVDGNNVLHAYDLSPAEDLDSDLNPDDGIVDFSIGTPYDEIWNVALSGVAGAGFGPGTRFGAPTLFSVNNGGVVVDQIAVQGSNGVTAVFNAFTQNGNGTLAPAPALLYTVVGAGGNAGGDFGPALINQHGGQALQAISPALSDGILFSLVYDSASGAFTDTNDAWRISPTDPLTGLNIFGSVKLGVAPSAQQLPIQPLMGFPMPVGSPIVGYITDYTTGAQDKIVYIPTLPDENTLNAGGAGLMHSELFSVKNDPLLDVSDSPGYVPPAPFVTPVAGTAFRATLLRGNIPWFAPALPWAGLRSMLPVCHRTSNGVTTDLVFDPTGGSANSFKLEYIADPTSPQQHQVWVLPNPALLPGDTITADYTVDWPAHTIPDQNGAPATPGAQDFLHSVNTVLRTTNPLGTNPGTAPLCFTGAAAFSSDDMVFANMGDAPFADRIYAMNVHFPVGGATIPGATKPEAPAVRWMFFPNGPVPDENLPTGTQGFAARLVNSDTFNGIYTPVNPVIATDLESIGAPAVSNGVVYQLGWVHMHLPNGSPLNEWDAAIIMAYQANPSLSFQLKDSSGSVIPLTDGGNGNAGTSNTTGTAPYRIVQADTINYVPGTTAGPLITLKQNANFTVDVGSSTITIFDCRPGGTSDCFNLAEPFSVVVNQPNSSGTTIVAGYQLNSSGHSVLDNLLWWMIAPIHQNPYGPVEASVPPVPGLQDVKPAGGATIIGHTLYYGTQHGNIAEVDLTNMPQDGSQATLYKPDGTLRMQIAPALFDTTVQHAVDLPVVSPPVGTTDVIVASSRKGISAFDNGLTLITDNNRLLQVNASVEAVWALDSTQTQTVVGGALGAGGNIASAKISLARPNKAIHDTLDTFIVADSGNNRVMQTNMGGVVGWEIHSFNDGMRFLRPGDPLTLNHPTDVQTYTLVGNGPISFTSPITNAVYGYTGYYYSYHYIVADSGNGRNVEIVDIYDANGAPIVMTAAGQPNATMLRQLIFVTGTLSEQNKTLRYRTVQQFVAPNGQLFMASVIDNAALGGVDPNNSTPGNNPPATDAPGGSVVILRRTGGALDGQVVSKLTGLYDPNISPTHPVPTHTAISGPTYFKEYESVDGKLHYLLCDSNGCYDLLPVTGATPNVLNGEAIVTWALYSTDYLTMTGRPLKASSLQRLGKSDYNLNTNLFYPHYLITNRYTGDDNIISAFGPQVNVTGSQIRGEVVEVRGDIYYDKVNYPAGYASNPGAPRGPGLYVRGDGNASGNYPVLGALYPQDPNTCAIVWMAPKETWQHAGFGPFQQVPIKRSIGSVSSAGTSSYILEQPTYSDRPY